MFINACFIIANDADAPESWLEWVGWRKLVFGANAHRRWYYTGPLGQPNRHVKWFIRSAASEAPEILGNLWHSFVCSLTGRELPWHKKAREAMEKAEDEATKSKAPEGAAPEAAAEEDDDASTTSSTREARVLRRLKHIYTTTGLASVYIVWGVFVWFIFVCACTSGWCACTFEPALTRPQRRRHADIQATRRPGRTGICPQLGRQLVSARTRAETAVLQQLTRAVSAFRSGLNAASEWKDVRPARARCLRGCIADAALLPRSSSRPSRAPSCWPSWSGCASRATPTVRHGVRSSRVRAALTRPPNRAGGACGLPQPRACPALCALLCASLTVVCSCGCSKRSCSRTYAWASWSRSRPCSSTPSAWPIPERARRRRQRRGARHDGPGHQRGVVIVSGSNETAHVRPLTRPQCTALACFLCAGRGRACLSLSSSFQFLFVSRAALPASSAHPLKECPPAKLPCKSLRVPAPLPEY